MAFFAPTQKPRQPKAPGTFVNAHGPAFNKPAAPAQRPLVQVKPAMGSLVHNQPVTYPKPKPGGVTIGFGGQTVKPAKPLKPAKPAKPGEGNGFTNKDIQYLMDRQQLDRNFKNQNADLSAQMAALNAKGDDGLTKIQREKRMLDSMRNKEESMGQADLAASGMFHSGQRDNLVSGILGNWSRSVNEAENSFGKGALAEIKKGLTRNEIQYGADKADLYDQARWRSTEAGGPAKFPKPKKKKKGKK